MNSRFTNIMFWLALTLTCSSAAVIAGYIVVSALADPTIANNFIAIMCLFAAIPLFAAYWCADHLYNCLTMDDISLQVYYGVNIRRGRKWPTL